MHLQSNEIIETTKIDKYFIEREELLKTYKQLEEIKGVRTCLQFSFGLDHYKRKCTLEEYTSKIDKYLWGRLIKESPFFDIMDSKLKSEWLNKTTYDKSSRRTTPPFTIDNVKNQMEALFANKDKMIVDKVEGLFKSLSWDHKTNSPNKINDKIILKNYDTFGYKGGAVSDMEDVLFQLQGKSIPCGKDRLNSLMPTWGAFDVENELFRGKRFKNGNLHLWIKNKELVNKLNKLISSRYGKFELGGRR